MHFLSSLVLVGFMFLPSGLARDRFCPLFVSEHERFGVNTTPKYQSEITRYPTDQLNLGWFIDYTYRASAPAPPDVAYVPLVSARGWDPETRPVNRVALTETALAQPGSLWILGNEMDRVDLQDDQPPQAFAQFYHETYHAIKQADPSARIAIGGIVQPTPIRLLYLDRVLQAYEMRYNQRLPVDAWTFHNFILREAANDWGADIPPGLDDAAGLGIRYEIADHGDLEIFKSQMLEFRRWMAARGYRNKPLLLSEYGILMPRQFGFSTEFVAQFMQATFNHLRTATDPELGYPLDDNRLVQAWSWYSLNDLAYDFETGIGANGHLFDHDSAEITLVGAAFADYTAPLTTHYSNLTLVSVQTPSPVTVARGQSIPVQVRLVNAGNQTARNVQVDLIAVSPTGAETRVGTQFLLEIASHCREEARVAFQWIPEAMSGNYTLRAEISAPGDGPGAFKTGQATIRQLPAGSTVYTMFVPQITREFE